MRVSRRGEETHRVLVDMRVPRGRLHPLSGHESLLRPVLAVMVRERPSGVGPPHGRVPLDDPTAPEIRFEQPVRFSSARRFAGQKRGHVERTGHADSPACLVEVRLHSVIVYVQAPRRVFSNREAPGLQLRPYWFFRLQLGSLSPSARIVGFSLWSRATGHSTCQGGIGH